MLPANQKRFWNVLKYGYDRNEVLKTNPDIMRAIKISQRVGRIIEPLSNFIFALAKRRIDGANYVHLTYNDDLVQESVKFMLIAVMKFDPAKSNNPYAYMSTCCTSAVIHYQDKEKKQEKIKMEMLARANHGQI